MWNLFRSIFSFLAALWVTWLHFCCGDYSNVTLVGFLALAVGYEITCTVHRLTELHCRMSEAGFIKRLHFTGMILI